MDAQRILAAQLARCTVDEVLEYESIALDGLAVVIHPGVKRVFTPQEVAEARARLAAPPAVSEPTPPSVPPPSAPSRKRFTPPKWDDTPPKRE